MRYLLTALTMFALMATTSYAQTWGDVGTIGTLTSNKLCHTDGVDIICSLDLTVNGTEALEVSGTVSATAFVGDGSLLTGLAAGGASAIDELSDGIHSASDTVPYSSLFLGNGAGVLDDGTDNTNVGIGKNALNAVATSAGNTAIGHRSLESNTASENTAVGAYSLRDTVGGGFNTAMGWVALSSNITGYDNTAMGVQALRHTESGYGNVAIGREAGRGVDNSSNIFRNVFVGRDSGKAVLTGADDNTFLGYRSGLTVTTGARNILIGSGVDTTAVTASDELNIGNLIVGDLSAVANTKIASGVGAVAIGVSSTASGDYSLALGLGTTASGPESVASGFGSVAAGFASFAHGNSASASGHTTFAVGQSVTAGNDRAIAMGGNITVSGSHAFGINLDESTPTTLSDTSTFAIMGAIGGVGIGTVNPNAALEVSGTVSATAFVGDGSLLTGIAGGGASAIDELSDGMTNAASGTLIVGHEGTSITSGIDNVSVGLTALDAVTTGNNNTAIGYNALTTNTTGWGNVAVGSKALHVNESSVGNVAVGNFALATNNGGDSNSAVGDNTLVDNFSGVSNSGFGAKALQSNRTGNDNTAFGVSAGAGVFLTSNISNNVFMGRSSGRAVLTGADDNTFLGFESGLTVTTGARNILIGSGVDTPTITTSDHLNIGDIITGTIAGAKQVSITAPLDVSGTVTVAGTGVEVCSANAHLGQIRFNPITEKFQLCRK